MSKRAQRGLNTMTTSSKHRIISFRVGSPLSEESPDWSYLTKEFAIYTIPSAPSASKKDAFKTMILFRQRGGRWIGSVVPQYLWIDKDANLWADTVNTHIGKHLDKDSRIEGLWVEEFSDREWEEAEELGKGFPRTLADRVANTLLNEESPFPARVLDPSTSKGTIAGWLIDPVLALAQGKPLDEWTINPITVVPDVSVEIEEEFLDDLLLSNGSVFHPRPFRTIKGGTTITDVGFMRMLRKPEHRRYPLLLGPGGTGKTSLVEASSDRMFTTLATAETTTLSLLGRYEPDQDGSYIFVPAELPRSIRYAQDHPDEAVTWYCDELMQMPEEVQTLLHPLTDHRRTLFIEEGPLKGALEAPDNWHAVFSSNPKEAGSSLTRPFASRLKPIQYLTNWSVVEAIVGPGHELLITLAQAMETMRRNEVCEWAPQIRHILNCVDDTGFLGMEYGLAGLLEACDLETGSCNSSDVQELDRLISEHFNVNAIQRLTMD